MWWLPITYDTAQTKATMNRKGGPVGRMPVSVVAMLGSLLKSRPSKASRTRTMDESSSTHSLRVQVPNYKVPTPNHNHDS